MSEQILIEALNDSLDRLASGQTIEDCLRAHADVADDLRILLETGQATKRVRADRAEIEGMRSRLDLHIDDLIENTEFSKPRFVIPQGSAVMLVASILLVFVGFFILFPREDSQVADDITNTATHTPEMTRDATFTPIPSVTLSETPTETASPTITASPTMTATPTITASPTATATATETASPTATNTANPTSSPEPTACIVTPPDTWESYQVQAGDTISSIATKSGTSVNNLMLVNCLENTAIMQGQMLFTPPITQANTQVSATQSAPSNNSNPPSVSTSDSDDDDEFDDDELDDDDHSDDEYDDDELDDD